VPVDGRRSRRVACGRTERLLDRAAETERLQHFVDLAGSGQGSAVVVSGPAGIGKTRLVSHVRQTCARAGMTVAAVRCGPLDGELSWSVMRELLDGVDGSSAVRGTSPAELIPSATFAVARAAAERPLLLAVDDIHWADPESVRRLAHLVLRVPELSVAVVVATRDDEPATHQAALFCRVLRRRARSDKDRRREAVLGAFGRCSSAGGRAKGGGPRVPPLAREQA
jgi:predicted ATPase